jgi:uncharacterized protein YgbK (DUF1537 family)
MKLAIIADDLTGAMDAAAPFAERGLDVRLVLCGAGATAPATATDIVAFDTNSRHLPDNEAAAAVTRCIAGLPPGTPIFKKIDSTLRGAVVAEIRAAAAGRGAIIIAPAVPSQGRTVRDRRVLIHGVPSGDAERRFAGSLTAALMPLRGEMPDCATESDLAEVVRGAPADALLVGAAGFARAVAQQSFGDAAAAPSPISAGPTLFVVGSKTAITAQQLAHLRQARPDAAIMTAPELREADSGAVARRLAKQAVARLRRAKAGALVLIGGDTARAALDALGVQALRVRGHIVAGIPWGEAQIEDRPVVIATKAGGFGAADALSRVAEILAEAGAPSTA